MANLSITAFLSKWSTKFASTGLGTITGAIMREFREDVADSFLNKTDGFMNDPTMASASSTTAPSSSSIKSYVNTQIASNINGIAWKESVKARTTAALAANTAGGGSTTLTANANGAFPNQDGIAIALNDDILVMNEATPANNGIYTLTQVGTGGTPWILTRRGDANLSAELQNAVVSVDQGTVHADTSWRQTTDGVTLGSSNIVWAGFNPTGVTGTGFTTNGLMYAGGTSSIFSATNAYYDAPNGRVGIGTTAPDCLLHIVMSSAGAVAANGNSALALERNTQVYLSLLVPNADESGILFGRVANNSYGWVIQGGTGATRPNALSLGVNSLTRMALWPNGEVEIPNATTPPVAAIANSILMYAEDSADATSTLALFLEQAVEAIGVFVASHKLKVRINGTEYWIQLDAV